MSDTLVLVPATMHDFNMALGTSLLRERGAVGLVLPDKVISAASAGAVIALAHGWHQSNRASLQLLAAIARHADDLDDEAAYASFWSDLDNDPESVRTFLDAVSPSYLRQLVEAGRGLDGEQFRSFLELLQQLSA